VPFDVVDGWTESGPRPKVVEDDAGLGGIEFTVPAGEAHGDNDICCCLNLDIFFGTGPAGDDAAFIGAVGARGDDCDEECEAGASY
jgi:hypothetical protein